jgi:excisionase family DNA binding protein
MRAGCTPSPTPPDSKPHSPKRGRRRAHPECFGNGGMRTEGHDMIELLTIEEVAERLRVSALTVRWLRREGRFAPAIKVGRRLKWDARDVAAWLDAQCERAMVA